MNAFVARLHFDTDVGAIHDGPRRYLMMRHDVLMGALARLDSALLATVLQAFTASTRQHGGDSIAAYAREQGLDRLLDITCNGAAALGWGTWHMVHQAGEALELTVHNSPFAAGAAGASVPMCAPIAGILHSVAEQVLGRTIHVTEVTCAANHPDGHHACHFVARPATA
jgi:predicted hydrocarbon binding protein